MDFGDLKEDEDIKEKITNFHTSIDKIEKLLENALNPDYIARDKLNTKEKVDYDIFMAYTLNTLYWLYLRTKGLDPNKHDVKNELNRVKDYMIKAKQVEYNYC